MAQQSVLIGIDAGTSLIKAVAFDLDGRQLAVASTPNRVRLAPGGLAEQDMDATWADTAATLRALADQVPGLARRAVGIACTAQGDGTWLVDAEGRSVGPALLWLDARARREAEALRASPAGRSVAERAGNAITAAMQHSQLLWLRQHQPERLARAATAFHGKDWLFFKATGLRRGSRCESVYTFGNLRTLDYDEATLAELGLSDLRHLLPPIATRTHEPLSREAAAETGLPAGLPVAAALMDVPLCVLGAGGLAYGADGRIQRVGCSVLGSTGMHGWISDEPDSLVPSAEAGFTIAMPHDERLRLRVISHMAATLNVDWLLKLLGQAAELAGAKAPPRQQLLDRLDALVLDTAPGQALYHPYIADSGERGPFVDADARAQLSGFGSGLGVAGLARAVYEGIALASRDCYEALGELPAEIRLSGGAARSAAMRQLLASVTGRPVRVSHREECGAAGAAISAAVAVGTHRSVREMLPQWVDAYLDPATTDPDPSQAAFYDALFPVYREMARRGREPWRALARARHDFQE